MLLPLLAQPQSTLRCMSYNLLNFPEPNPQGKVDTLRKILQFHPVDLLICQELRTQAAALSVLDEALNVDGEDRFSMAGWQPQVSGGGGGSYSLQQIVYFDHDKLGLKEQAYLTTFIRDINVYTFYLKDDLLGTVPDTTFLTVYAVHFKAGSTPTDVTERNAMAQTLVAHLVTLPPQRAVMVAGDMNLYTAFEPAFQTLLSSSNAIQLRDPANAFGGWGGSSAYAALHTQSTRVNVIYSDGAGGGLDDRFDIALVSDGLMNPTSRLHHVNGTYRALGNSGTCFNANITSCSAIQTPYAILQSLYYMSDHLPVVFTLDYQGIVSSIIGSTAYPARIRWREGLGVEWENERAQQGTFRLLDLLGRTVVEETRNWPAGLVHVALPQQRTAGVCIASFAGTDGTFTQRLFISGP